MICGVDVLSVAGPEGVQSPVLVSTSPRSVLVIWGDVGRLNSNSSVAFQLQFRAASQSTVIKYVRR